MKTMTLRKDELETINEIVNELGIQEFELIFDNSSGIGYFLDLEYQTVLNNRNVTVRVSVTGVDKW